MKRLLLACASLVLIHAFGDAKTIPVKDFTCDGIKYTDMGMTVVGPESKDITKVVIPSVVRYEGGEANVEYIIYDGFHDCPKLESITIPGSVREFSYDRNKEDYSSEKKERPLSGTPSLKEIILEYGEEPLRLPYPFVENDWNLTNLVINRKFLTNDIVNDGDGKYHWEDFPVFEGLKADTVKLLCGIPVGTMEYLPDNVFQKSAINTLEVGAGLESLGANTFIDMQQSIINLLIENCDQPLKFYRKVVGSIDNGNGTGMMWSKNVPSFDQSAISQLEMVNMWRTFDLLEETKLFANVKEVNIGGAVSEIQPQAFAGTGIETVRFNDGVETIGNGAFSGCDELKEVYLPSTIKEIAYNLFSGCQSLTSVIIPLGVTSIEDGAFMMCPSLNALELPSSLFSIKPWAFLGSGLTSVEIPESVETIGEMAFMNCPLEYIRVFRETPLDENAVSPQAFDSYNTTKLIVPRVSIGAYEETSPWSSFDWIVSEPWIKCIPEELLLSMGVNKAVSFEVMDAAVTQGFTFRCESENPDVFMVDPDTQELIPVSEGTAYLNVTAVFDGFDGLTDRFLVTVIADSAVDSIIFDADEIVTVFNMNGIKIGEFRYSDLSQTLPSGLYILRTLTGNAARAMIR